MNANEGFEQFAKEFQTAFGYLPLGKDDPGRPCAENILADLCETWRKLRAAQPATAAPSAAPNTGMDAIALVLVMAERFHAGMIIDEGWIRTIREVAQQHHA